MTVLISLTFGINAVKNEHKSDTAGRYHITIVSFIKHFLELYIFIIQGSSLVEIETQVLHLSSPL